MVGLNASDSDALVVMPLPVECGGECSGKPATTVRPPRWFSLGTTIPSDPRSHSAEARTDQAGVSERGTLGALALAGIVLLGLLSVTDLPVCCLTPRLPVRLRSRVCAVLSVSECVCECSRSTHHHHQSINQNLIIVHRSRRTDRARAYESGPAET